MWATLCLGQMSLPWIARLKRSRSLRHQRRQQRQTVSLIHFALPHLIRDIMHTNMQLPPGNSLGACTCKQTLQLRKTKSCIRIILCHEQSGEALSSS